MAHCFSVSREWQGNIPDAGNERQGKHMKAIVLSSGGVDSTTCIALAVAKLGREHVSTVSIYYGQKHARELACARKVAERYGLAHYEFDLAQIMSYSNSALLKGSTQEIEHSTYGEQSAGGKVSTDVPFRNGLMLSVAASLAAGLYEGENVALYIGAHADDVAGAAYADCSAPFMESMGNAVNIGTYGKVHVEAPFLNAGKADVVRTGLELHAPYELTWSCYEDGEEPCGLCATCRDRARAFAANGVEDPALPSSAGRKEDRRRG